MSLRYKILLLVGFVVVTVISLFIVNITSDTSIITLPTTFSTRSSGFKALFIMLEELGFPVARLRRTYSNLKTGGGALVVVDPQIVPFSSREIKQLKEWIKKGNTLILLHGGPQDYTLFPRVSRKKEGSKKSGNLNGVSLADRLGIKVKQSYEDTRNTVIVSTARLYGVHKLSVSSKTRWRISKGTWTTIVRDKAGPIIVSKKMGKGEVIAISDASMASNRGLPLAENVRLLPALLLEKGKPSQVMFDEYHHGYSMADSFWHYVSSSIFGWILLQIFVASALVVYSRRATFAGRYRSLTQPGGRSSLEYVNSLANVLESSHAGSVALDAILRRFLSRLARKTGTPLSTLEEQADERIRALVGEEQNSNNLVSQCREAVTSGEDTSRTLVLARRLSELRSQLVVGPK